MSNTTQLCTFSVCDLLFGIEVESVQEVIRFQEMTQVPLAHPQVEGLINLRGQIVTAIDMRRRLGLEKRPSDSLPMNVVLAPAYGTVSFLVDEIGDVLDLGDEYLEAPPSTLAPHVRNLVRGIYKLESRLLLAIDPTQAITPAGAVV